MMLWVILGLTGSLAVFFCVFELFSVLSDHFVSFHIDWSCVVFIQMILELSWVFLALCWGSDSFGWLWSLLDPVRPFLRSLDV